MRLLSSLVAISAVAVLGTGCRESSSVGPDAAAGTYRLAQFVSSQSGQEIDWLAQGAAGFLRLNRDGTSEGSLESLAGLQAPSIELAGTWTREGRIVRLVRVEPAAPQTITFEVSGASLIAKYTVDSGSVVLTFRR
jgi:hypothetical protein